MQERESLVRAELIEDAEDDRVVDAQNAAQLVDLPLP
jgi:hypothetical protein